MTPDVAPKVKVFVWEVQYLLQCYIQQHMLDQYRCDQTRPDVILNCHGDHFHIKIIVLW